MVPSFLPSFAGSASPDSKWCTAWSASSCARRTCSGGARLPVGSAAAAAAGLRGNATPTIATTWKTSSKYLRREETRCTQSHLSVVKEVHEHLDQIKQQFNSLIVPEGGTDCKLQTERGDSVISNRSQRCSGSALIYRTTDGTCNNLERPDWGSSFTKFLRFLPPVYRDDAERVFNFGSFSHFFLESTTNMSLISSTQTQSYFT